VAYRRRRDRRRPRRITEGTAATSPIRAVQNFSTMVSWGSHCKTMATAVTIVIHIGDLHGDANSDVVDGAAGGGEPCPDLDSGRRPPQRKGAALMRDQLRRLHELAGSPTKAQMKEHADRRGHSVGRSTLATVTVDGGSAPRWATVEAFIDACAAYADARKRPLPAREVDMLVWKTRYDQTHPRQRKDRPPPAPQQVRVVGMAPGSVGHGERGKVGIGSAAEVNMLLPPLLGPLAAAAAPQPAARNIGKVALRDAVVALVRDVAAGIPDVHRQELVAPTIGETMFLLEAADGGRVLVDALALDQDALTAEAVPDMPRHWAVLFLAIRSDQVQFDLDTTRPSAAFNYRSQNRFTREILREILLALLRESRELLAQE
jgi:hypothetical protein